MEASDQAVPSGRHRNGELAGASAGVTIMYDAGTIRSGMDGLLPLADLLVCSGEFDVVEFLFSK